MGATLHDIKREEVGSESWGQLENRAQVLLHQTISTQDFERSSPSSIPHARRVFVNRNLRMDKVELVGFDMDYTLAIYIARRVEQLSFDMTLSRLVEKYGYPADIGKLLYEHEFVMRGLHVDKWHGNLLKMDRFGHVGRAFHGRKPLEKSLYQKLYRNEVVKVKNPRYAWLDTLFALPEACLYAGIIELLEAMQHPVDYARLYDDIREAIDSVHRDNSLKREIRKNIGYYIFRDMELGPALHKLRSSGKKLFLLTNSHWDYTQAVMSYLLDGLLPEYTSWKNYFDWIIVAAGKPAFFSDQQPFLELDVSREAAPVLSQATSLDRGKIYQGGNLKELELHTGYAGENVLYVGDHIHGDILKSKKTSTWRTCLIVQELEEEINYTDLRRKEIHRLAQLEALRAQLDDEANMRKAGLHQVDRRLEKDSLSTLERRKLDEERVQEKTLLETVRKAHREASHLADAFNEAVEVGFNRYWGLLFKEGNENSKFGEQVEKYACIYTSRVSNLVNYSPMQYFRAPRSLMPHERAGSLSGKMSPLRGEPLFNKGDF